VHKGVINDGGIPFIGHTEYLAEQTHRSGGYDARGRGPARRSCDHAPRLEGCARALTRERLEQTIRVLHAELIPFGISAPRILVAGLIRIAARAAISEERKSK